MFGLGMPEILLILAIALIVIGPKKLPDLAKTLGRAMGEFKRSAQDFKASIDIDTTVKDISDLKPTESKLKKALKDANDEAFASDSEDDVFTRDTPDMKDKDPVSITVPEKPDQEKPDPLKTDQDIAEQKSNEDSPDNDSPDNDSPDNDTRDPSNPEKNDSIKHE
ncbi:MAG: twin-arginine translocase TatA/TatE family subunit [Desulfobacula sp.]|nr:twin-arginine translocase TatA/TatE family subunit [Desulfobacula sp.]